MDYTLAATGDIMLQGPILGPEAAGLDRVLRLLSEADHTLVNWSKRSPIAASQRTSSFASAAIRILPMNSPALASMSPRLQITTQRISASPECAIP